MPNFLAQQQGGTKNTYIHKNRISALLLYLFYIRKVFLEGTSKSSTAFFTVYVPQYIFRVYTNAFQQVHANIAVPNIACMLEGHHLKGLSHEIDFDNIAKN